MKPNKYQRLCLRNGDNVKLNEYQTGARKTAIYPGELMYPTLGLFGEVAELLGSTHPDDVAKEIGDVLWYVANVAADADLRMSDVCKRKTFRFKGGRYWNVDEAFNAIVINAGVVAENVKKTVRDNAGVLKQRRRDNIRLALKEVVLALMSVARFYNVTLEECANLNLDKLASRAKRGVLTGDGNDR